MENREKDREQLRAIQAVFEKAVKNNTIEDKQNKHITIYILFCSKKFIPYYSSKLSI